MKHGKDREKKKKSFRLGFNDRLKERIARKKISRSLDLFSKSVSNSQPSKREKKRQNTSGFIVLCVVQPK